MGTNMPHRLRAYILEKKYTALSPNSGKTYTALSLRRQSSVFFSNGKYPKLVCMHVENSMAMLAMKSIHSSSSEAVIF